MKNLKKVLSLGLALVMLLGMMSFASAADAASTKLADMDKVTNKDEVSLLVDLGVISGIKEGDQMLYKPENNIQRDAWAKMVYFVMQGNADYKVLENSSNLKDIANNWANGCISYLATQKIVSGDDLGNYNPLRSIKVAEAAKTLLTAAGWDASDRDYTGASWSGSVMSDAKRFGLMNGIALTANDTLTRDAAAKMIVNALDLEVVKAVRKPMYVGTGVDKFVDRYDTQNTTLGHQAFGLAKVTGVVDELDEDGNIVFRTGTLKDATGTALATADAAKVVIAGNASMVGQSVVIYVKANATYKGYGNGKIDLTKVDTVASVISSTPVLGGMTVLKTVTGGVDWENCYTAPEKGQTNDAFIVESDATVYYYANGVKAGTTAPTDLNPGEVAEFCDTDDNGKADLVRVFNWKVAVVGDDGVKTTTDKNGTYVTVDGIVDTPKTPAANVVGYESLEAGDVVLYYATGAAAADTTVIEKAETFTGDVTGRNNKTGALTIAGKPYTKSGIFDAALADVFAVGYDLSTLKNHTWALDKNGDVCFYVAPADAKPATETALVLGQEFTPGKEGSLTSAASSDKALVQLLFTDGTSEIVNVAQVGDKKINDEDNALAESDLSGLVDKLVAYSKDSKNNYTLTAYEAQSSTTEGYVNIGVKDITASSKFDGTNRANDNTIFVVTKVIDKDTTKIDIFKGYKNVPGMKTIDGNNVALVSKEGVAKIVYLTTDSYEGDAPAGYIYVADIVNYETVVGQDYVTLTIVSANGEPTTAKFAEVPASVGLYKVTKVDENGVIMGLDTKAGTESVTEDLAMSGGIFTVGNNTYEYDGSTKIILIELTKDGDTATYTSASVVKAGEIKAADGLEILVNGKPEELVDTIYIIRTTNA